MAKGKYEEWLEPDNLLLLQSWARTGLTDAEIACKIGISRSTLSEWKIKHELIADTLKQGKEVVDIQVENALLKRALGYKYTEKTSELKTDPNTGDQVMVLTKQVVKEVVPDTTAQIFWLKNRKPNEWRDKARSGNELSEDKINELEGNISDMFDAVRGSVVK